MDRLLDLAVVGSRPIAKSSPFKRPVIVSWVGIGSQNLGQAEGTRTTSGENLIIFVLCGVGVSDLHPHLKGSEVRVDAVAPGQRCRSLIIDLRGVVGRKNSVRHGVLRGVVNTAVVLGNELRAKGIALIQCQIGAGSAEVGGRKILATN